MKRSLWIALAALALCGARRMSPIHSLKPADAQKLLAEGGVFLVDVRSFRDYQAGHIASAVLIPITGFPTRLHELPSDKTQPILVYDTAGGASTRAAKILAQNGYKDIYNLIGGLRAWTTEQRPLEKNPAPPAK